MLCAAMIGLMRTVREAPLLPRDAALLLIAGARRYTAAHKIRERAFFLCASVLTREPRHSYR